MYAQASRKCPRSGNLPSSIYTAVVGKMPNSHSDDSSRVAQILCKFAALFFSFYLHSDFLNHMSVEKETGRKLAPKCSTQKSHKYSTKMWQLCIKRVFLYKNGNICILCHNLWTNQILDLLSIPKWLSEPQFCER